ncbi:MAG: anti-sigma factor family protein [Chitinispirillaceae bacterium]
MACSKFEESGLLYCSDELDEHDIRRFEEHLEKCEECRLEVEDYKRESASFYTVDMLGENPSEAVDREILRVCASAKKQHTFGLFPLFFKKTTVMSLMLFVVGFAAMGYIVFNMERAETLKAKISAPGQDTVVADVQEQNSSSVALTESDSAHFDSLGDSSAGYSGSRGDLNTDGVITVDLKD